MSFPWILSFSRAGAARVATKLRIFSTMAAAVFAGCLMGAVIVTITVW